MAAQNVPFRILQSSLRHDSTSKLIRLYVVISV